MWREYTLDEPDPDLNPQTWIGDSVKIKSLRIVTNSETNYFSVWIFALTVLTVIAAQPLGMGEMGDLYGGQTMGANHVPRLGRRSLSPLFKNNGFRFFGRAPSRNRAGFLGPLFSDRYQNFRFYGGRPGEELARGLLRDKKKDLQQPNVQIMPELEKSGAEETQVEPRQEDQEYWKNVLSEATINSVLEKMVW